MQLPSFKFFSKLPMRPSHAPVSAAILLIIHTHTQTSFKVKNYLKIAYMIIFMPILYLLLDI